MENKKFFGYKAAIGAFLVIFCNLGAASTLGVFLPSMSEYTGWSVAVLGYNGTFNRQCFAEPYLREGAEQAGAEKADVHLHHRHLPQLPVLHLRN